MKHSLPIGYTFRAAKNEDATDIKKVIFSVLEEYGLPLDPENTDADLHQPADYYKEGYFGVVKNVEDTIVGTFGLLANEQGDIEIRKMYLLPTERGKRIGKFMMDTLLEKSKQMGYQKVVLETASPLKEAIAMYEKYGFILDESGPHTCRCDRLYYKSL